MPLYTDDTQMYELTEPVADEPNKPLALEFIEVGQNEDGEHVILLTGTYAAVQEAGKLFGQQVVLMPAQFFAEELALSASPDPEVQNG